MVDTNLDAGFLRAPLSSGIRQQLMVKKSWDNDGLLKILEVYSQRFKIVFQLRERTDETGILDSASPWAIVKCLPKPGRIDSAFSCSHVFSGSSRCQSLFKRCSDFMHAINSQSVTRQRREFAIYNWHREGSLLFQMIFTVYCLDLHRTLWIVLYSQNLSAILVFSGCFCTL